MFHVEHKRSFDLPKAYVIFLSTFISPAGWLFIFVAEQNKPLIFMKQKIRIGMVGGGIGAFIGAVHRMAAALDGEIELVCGAFSSDPEKSKKSGAELGLPPERCYGTFQEMIKSEERLRPDKRMHAVSIVTPNHLHFPPAKMALQNGFHVICDKPLAFNMKEALALEKLVEESGMIFAMTHN